MISLTPIATADQSQAVDPADLHLYLALASQELIASLRATDPRAAASHCTMAAHYSAKAVAMLEAGA